MSPKLWILPLLTSLALAQAPATAEVPPDTVVAVLNGRKFTAEEIRRVVAGTPPQARAVFSRDPKAFLRDHAALLSLVEYADKNQLDKLSPHRETLEFYRLFVLSNAAINHKRGTLEVTPEEHRAYYDKHQAEFREARVRMIYFPFTDLKTEKEARGKADAVVKQAYSGADFVKLAGEEFAVRMTSAQPPESMRKVILSAPAGTITQPLRHDNGFYVFRVASSEVLPWEKVRDEIYKEIQNTKFREWQQGLQSQVSVKIENEAFFSSITKQ